MTGQCQACGRTLGTPFKVLVREWNDDRERYRGIPLTETIVCRACADAVATTVERLVHA